MENPLLALKAQGQSIWLDNIRRDFLDSGGLQKLIEDDGIRGVTSNPTIFEKAIGGSRAYDAQLRRLVSEGKSSAETLDALMIEDIQRAADLFRPVYEESGGRDGFISIEVSPLLAHRLEETITAAKALHMRIHRPNIMIKVPATPEGVQAFERLTAAGICVNVTLIFAIENYEAVARAYISGLKKRAQEGGDLSRVRSVASLFVSRVDTVVDRQLAEKISETQNPEEKCRIQALLGKLAIANTKMVYQRFKSIFQGEAFQALRKAGARSQRPLWASTGTKNPSYSDVRYLEELVGPDTVNTVPPATLAAFRDHGKVRARLEDGLAEAERVLRQAGRFGIDLKKITDELQVAGLKAFSDSFQGLLRTIEAKRVAIVSEDNSGSSALGAYEQQVQKILESLDEMRLSARIWEQDASLWSIDPETQAKIRNRLGWLSIPEKMHKAAQEITAFAYSVKASGIAHLILLGMGGSSLCPEVLRKTFGSATGFPELIVLDTTDPETILGAKRRINLERSLFIVASKSGATIEMQCLYRYFSEKMREIKGEAFGAHFIAITDPGSALEALARKHRFRKCFLSPPDVGGRYSALTYFGLVPAALIGIDLEHFLGRAEALIQACSSARPAAENPAIHLGAALATLAKAGRDKLTLVASESIQSFGIWAEQLVAESTGKEGFGLVPIEGEALSAPEAYGDDRIFVYLRENEARNEALDAKVSALRKAGQPVVVIRLRDAFDLAGEFFRWEMATAVAGMLLGINPFDEPNVSESKANTAKVLAECEKSGELALPPLVVEEKGVGLSGGPGVVSRGALRDALAAFLSQVKSGDYVALMAYLPPSEASEGLLQAFRQKIRSRYRLATTLGYGPRFLHSTGQLHKGGAKNGLFIQMTACDKEDLDIPGAPYSFGTLKRAQALGDFYALRDRGLRVIELRLGDAHPAGLERVLKMLC